MSQHPPHVPDESHADPETRVPIGEAAADEREGDEVPTGLPPERQHRDDNADEDPGSQETG